MSNKNELYANVSIDIDEFLIALEEAKIALEKLNNTPITVEIGGITRGKQQRNILGQRARL